ncbi:glycoside hydrolase family 36 protein [Paenibacillus sp. OV219]|uniref:glycoside hydrolase family 36 protein n=1 Tax=Paenibacillus sp. OV219 TaxID=1884377 RepID=UPI0008D78384|nr:glycoside hydrolase family 36 protein [Paenibacillus sp. OV219]SEO33512.1 alpha-galactosidase [Paenibacillus sp. OV219]
MIQIPEFIRKATSFVRAQDGTIDPDDTLRIIVEWEGVKASSRLINAGKRPQAVNEMVLFKGAWHYTEAAKFYGEGYSMLSQYGGTIGNPELIGGYDDHLHYRLQTAEGYFTVYNMVLLSPNSDDCTLIGFSSCKRFTGEIRLADGHFEIVLNGEGLVIEPGESWELEQLVILPGGQREELLEYYAGLIAANHPPLLVASVPNGWCSWYWFGPQVTEEDIYRNLNVIGQTVPKLQYIQIDDGYQAYMGDWLTPGRSFGNMQGLCRQIRASGSEPAIWVAPFIAERNSSLLRDHPDWFVQDAQDGGPLASDTISFGGWRNGPWYMLDGTHPEARGYLRHVFKTMREEWGCRYFKLDANIWGALPGGLRYNRQATKTEAYRLGMQAVFEGAGSDSFLLGCNAPMWPSLGTVHGMRVTGDIDRNWPTFASLAAECFCRNWQHQRLWINDPDCIVLENRFPEADAEQAVATGIEPVTEQEFQFHMAYIVASGGMVLSGDDLTSMSADNAAILRKAVAANHAAARFEDDRFRIGIIKETDRQLICLFNWENDPISLSVQLDEPGRIVDYWNGEDYGEHLQQFTLEELAPRSARVLEFTPLSLNRED